MKSRNNPKEEHTNKEKNAGSSKADELKETLVIKGEPIWAQQLKKLSTTSKQKLAQDINRRLQMLSATSSKSPEKNTPDKE